MVIKSSLYGLLGLWIQRKQRYGKGSRMTKQKIS